MEYIKRECIIKGAYNMGLPTFRKKNNTKRENVFTLSK